VGLWLNQWTCADFDRTAACRNPLEGAIDYFSVAVMVEAFHPSRMSEIIYPRSPRETMDGWSYLPRYVDKIRLHLAGKLHSDYTENLGRAFDGFWLKAAGVTHEQFVAVVKNSLTDGEVCDWVRTNVKRTAPEEAAHWQDVLSRRPAGDEAACAWLKARKESSGIAHRDEIKTFVDYIDADEKRI